MADLRIVDAPVLLKEMITGDVKMPTGGLGNYAIRLGDLVWYTITKEQLTNKSYVDQQDDLKADKATTYTKDETYNREEIDNKDGDLATLATTDKTNLVKAINELHDTTKGVVDLYDKNVELGGDENGLVASLIKDTNGLTQQQINEYNHVKSPEMFGAKGKLNDDKTVFANLNPDYIFALGKEYSMDVWRSPARSVQGNNTTVHLNSASGTDTTTALQIPSGAHYSDINFVNNPNSNIEWSYGTCGSDVVLTNIGFYNFIDTNTRNAWGLYLENKNNVTLNSPKFGNNTLADIAIVDNVSNVTINNAVDTVNPDGVILDIEPNNDGNIENINVIGGKYSHIAVLENSFTSNGIKGVNIIGATVKLLELRGGQVKVSNSKVERIKGNWVNAIDYAGYQNEYFGKLEIDNINLSKNLIADDKVLSFSGYEPSSFWVLYAPDTVDTKTTYDNDGFYTALNATKQSAFQSLKTRNYIDLPSGATQVATLIGYSVDNSTDSAMFEPVILSFYDSNNQLVGKDVSIKGGRTAKGTQYAWSNEVNIYDVPSGATKLKLEIVNNKKGSTLNIRKIGVHALSMTGGSGNFNAIMQSYAQPNLTKTLKVQQALSYSIDANAVKYTEKVVMGAKVGDMVQISTTSPIGTTSRIWAEISSDNTLAIYHQNLTAAVLAIDTTANFIIQ